MTKLKEPKKKTASTLSVKKMKVEKLKEEEVKEELKEIQGADYWINRPADDEHRDWLYETQDWVSGYEQSVDHPHRQLILDALPEVGSLAEIGCNVGPNLKAIRAKYPNVRLWGMDVSPEAVKKAQSFVVSETVDVVEGNFLKLPWDSKSMDAVLADAVLMYANPDEIKIAMDEIDRVVRNLVIIVDRFDKKESNNGYIWARNYKELLEAKGFVVESTKITEKNWPGSKGWAKDGYIFVGLRYFYET
jgi:SAM-dependent methyltransferase